MTLDRCAKPMMTAADDDGDATEAGAGAAPLRRENRADPPPVLRAVEADARLAERLRAFLAEQGLPCGLHAEADSLFESLSARPPPPPPRLVLIGVEEPGGALPVLRRLRAASRVPCILLAGGLDEAAGAAARDAGADDAADRAAPLPAVLARIRAVLRRAEWGAGPAGSAPAAPGSAAAVAATVGLDGWRLLPDRRQLLRPDGCECPLTTAEFDLVRVLVERRGRAVSRDAIARSVFGRPFRPEDRTVDNLVLRLRRKLDTAHPQAIRTVRGLGYMFAGFGGGGAGERAA
jgi:DNA-binding response OmpR family regulator